MITSKKDYDYYLMMDAKALGRECGKPKFFGDEIWKFERELRRGEYLLNCKPCFWKLRFMWHKFKFHYLSILCCGYDIPYNTFEEGLALIHFGPIIVNCGAKCGHNCRVHSGVTIGATNGSHKAAMVGNNVYMASGAKIIGEITIGDNVAIAANAVCVHDVPSGVTVGGVPAKVVSEHDSSIHLTNLKPY